MAEKSLDKRQSQYKNSVHGVEDLRRKRAEMSVSLRKQSRDEQLLKRRAISPEPNDDIQPETMTPDEIINGLKSSDLHLNLVAARAARRMLSQETKPPISTMVDVGVIEPLVEALGREDCPGLQFEAAWAITNIASGTHQHTMAVITAGAVGKLVNLLKAGGTLAEQSAWALGNIAGDAPQPRDIVLNEGALPALLPLLSLSAPHSQLRTAVWTYSNFCRNKNPMVKFSVVAPGLPYISDLLEANDDDVLADACWALSYLTDGPNDRIEAVQNVPNLLTRLIRLLDHKCVSVRTPALRAIGNMLTGSDEQTDRCIEQGCLQLIIRLLQCNKSFLVKEAAWAASNILAGTHKQIQTALDSGILPPLISIVVSEDIKCYKEAAWAITNLCLGGTPSQLNELLAAGFLVPYCMLLTSPDPKAVTVVLDGITSLLQAADKCGQLEMLCLKLEEVGALDQIESLQHHENEQIYKKVVHILDSYFSEHEDVNAQPKKTDKEYQFGAPEASSSIQF